MAGYDDIVGQMRADQAATGTAPNPYDNTALLLRQQADQVGAQAALTVGMQADQNGDEVARNMRLAKRYKTTPEVVSHFPEEFKQRALLEDARTAMANAPTLQATLAASPATAALIHDDLHPPAAIEQVANAPRPTPVNDAIGQLLSTVNEGYRSANAAVAPAFGKVAQAAGAPFAAFDALAGTTTADVPFSVAQWFNEYAQRNPADNSGGFVKKLAQTAGSTLGLITEAMATGGTAAPEKAGATLMEALLPRLQHGVQAMLVPSAISSQEVAQQVLDRGGSLADATKAGVASYITNTLGGVVPFATPGKLAYRLGTGAVSGTLLAENSRNLMNWALPEDMRSAPATNEERSLDALTGAIFGGMVGPRGPVHDLMREAHAAAQADHDYMQIGALGELSAASKWRERDPEGFRNFVARVTEDGNLPNVFVEGKVFAQALDKAGINADELTGKMPELAGQLKEALETDGYVRIPTADYATSIAGTPLDAQILQHLKTDPEGKTYAEAQEFYQGQADQMKEVAAGLAQEKQEADAFRQSQAVVLDQVHQQLDALGRFPTDVNKVNATITTAILSRIAAHEGIMPEEALAKYGARVVAEQPATGFAQRKAPDTPEFQNWFGGSKVVDADGKPLVVYHGTDADFSTFDSGKLGTATAAKSAQQGHFFVSDPSVAAGYSHHAATNAKVQQAMAHADVLEKKAQRTGKAEDWAAVDKAVEAYEKLDAEVANERLRGQNVMPVYLSLKNPVEFDAQGKSFTDLTEQINTVLRDAKRAGHDGVILRNLDDDPGINGKVADHFVVFKPEQIKSVHNEGTFDPSNPNILKQEGSAEPARGAYSPGANTIALLKDANLSTYLHETGHWALDAFSRIASMPDAPPAIRADMDKVLKWFGITGDEVTGKPGSGAPLAQSADPFRTFLIRNGVALRLAKDFAPGSKERLAMGRTFRKDGLELDALAERAAEQGFIENAADVDGLYDLISRNVSGEPVHPLYGEDGEASLKARLDRQRELEEDADAIGALVPEDDDVPWDVVSNASTEDAMRSLGFTEEEIRDAVADETRGPQATGQGHSEPEQVAGAAAGKTDPASAPEGQSEVSAPRRTPLEVWRSMTLDEQREHHEKFARGFEAYLMEGKAPSQELQPFFARVRSWLVNIYRDLRALGVPLTSEVRGVFDRMLASQEAIQEAQAARVFEPLFKDKPAGMTADEWAAYQDLGSKATDDAIDQMQRKSLADMKWLSGAKSKALKALQKQAATARKEVRAEVEKQVLQEPVYRMQDWLKANKVGKDKLDPEMLAEMFGFPTGDEAMRALADAPPRAEVIDGMTDRTMLERHGELASPDAIERAANDAVHNDARARFVATGLKVLTKSPIPAKELVRGAKEAADAAVGGQKVRNLSPRQYEAAEAKANREALKLVAKDPEGAVQAQRASLLNNQLVKSTHEAIADIQKGLEYFAKLSKDSVREKIDVAFREQIDQLLSRYDLRKSVTPEQAFEKNIVSLEAFVEKLAAMKFAVDVPERMIVDANRTHFKDMTVEDFRGLVDAVKSLDHLGRTVQQITDGTESRMLADVAAEAVVQTDKLPKRTAETNRGLTRIAEKWLSLKSQARSLQASLLKMEQMVDWLDDYNPKGVFTRMVFRKIAEAEGRRNDLDLRISKKWEELVAKLPKEVLKEGRKVYVMDGTVDGLTGEPQRLTWNQKMALAGIRGDAQHFSKLLRGEGWDPQAVLSFLDKNMSKVEWQFVREISDTFQEIFPLKQQMLRELGGTAPKPADRIAFQTPHGEQPGWYWPITYDPARSHSVKERSAKHEASLFEDNIYTRADTSTGREQTRNDNYAKPMLLSIDALPRVLKDEIRDITMRKAIIEADRFLSHPDVRRSVEGVLSPEHYDQFNGWLLSLANDAAVKPSELKMWDRLMHEIRTRTTMVGLGFRVSTMIMHGTTAAGESVAEAGFGTMAKGIFNKKTWSGLMGQLGPEWLNKGLESFTRDSQWVANRDFIVERSAEMRHRMNETERDVREQLRAIHLELMDPATGALERGKLAITSRAYQGIAMLDMASALPTWMGAYLKAMTPKAKGGLEMNEQDAVYFADKTVRNAHGGGGVKDMAAIQRGSEFQKLFTMFYTFWNHNINRIIDTAKRVKELPRTYGEAQETGDWGGFRGDVGTLILRTFMYTLGVQAVHHMMHPPKEGEGEEGWAKWFGKQMALSAFGGVPLARDVVNHFAGGKDYDMSPVTSVVRSTDQLYKDLKDGSTHERWIKHAMTEAGYILGMPLGQPASTAQFMSDVWDGKQHPQDITEWWRGVTTGDMHKH